MSQVSKAFRRLVMNPKAVGVWKVAFDLNPDLPKPPPRVRESQWAFMLYGPGICGVCSLFLAEMSWLMSTQECGGYGALTDFSFLKRYCEFCIVRFHSPLPRVCYTQCHPTERSLRLYQQLQGYVWQCANLRSYRLVAITAILSVQSVALHYFLETILLISS